DALQTRGNIYPISVDSGFVMDDIALVDTDPEPHSARLVDLGSALRHGLLDGDRAFNGIHDAAKLGENPVACPVAHTATVVANDRQDYGLVRLEITNGGSLVSAHQRAVAGDIGSEDRCQFAGNLWISRNIRHPWATTIRGQPVSYVQARLAQSSVRFP